MPGARLTQQERLDIAAGLAEGASLAVIARRLGRPTSTISREVTRNGGPEWYRAGLAERAAGERARRRGPAANPPQPGREQQTVIEFRERMVAVMVKTGLTRMAASVLACLYTSEGGSLTAAELVQRLRVSPASVSHAVGVLAGQELIMRVREGAGRRERYVLDDDIWIRSWLASARANAKLVGFAREGVEIFGPGSATAARLENMAGFLARVSQDMIEAAERYRHEFSAGGGRELSVHSGQ